MKKVLSLTAAIMLLGSVFSFAQNCTCPCCQNGKCCSADGAEASVAPEKVPAYLRLYVKDGGVIRQKQPKAKKARSPKKDKATKDNSGANALSGTVSAAVNSKVEKQKTQNSSRKQKRIDEVAKAIEEDRFASVQNLLERVSPLDKSSIKVSLFHLAIIHERFDFVRYWLKDDRVSSLLKDGNIGIVCDLVEKRDTPANQKDRNLVEANRNAVLKLLLDGGANPNALCYSPQDSEKAPAMFLAAGYGGNLPAVRLLANHGAKADFSILDIAVYWHNSGIVDFLLKKYPQIDKHQLNSCGENLVFTAVKSPLSNADVDVAMTVDVLLKAGVRKDIVAKGGLFCNYAGMTPLQVAQQENLRVTADVLSR